MTIEEKKDAKSPHKLKTDSVMRLSSFEVSRPNANSVTQRAESLFLNMFR